MGEAPTQKSASSLPGVNALTARDVRECLQLGLSDFARAPLIGIALGAIFAAIGLVIVLSLFASDVPWLAYPFAIGFPLVGPFAAAGIYEVSRTLERDETPSLASVFSALWAQRRRELGWLARSEEHTSELQSRQYLVCRLLLEKKNKNNKKPQKWMRYDDESV